MRTSHTQLPKIQELIDIMKKEAWRDPPHDKEQTHYPKFDIVIEWLQTLGLDPSLFTAPATWEDILTQGEKMRAEVIKRTLKNHSDHNLQSILKKVTAYLGETDIPKKSDLIFVFGSQNIARMQSAIDLWKQGLAPNIFITGGHPYYQETRSEAEVFKDFANKQGVPEDKIIIEPQAISVADNVRRSINYFEEKHIKYSSMILVTAWFVQRRSWAFMSKYIPSDYKLYRVNTLINADGDYAEKRWFTNENGIKIIFGEFVKLRIGVALNTA